MDSLECATCLSASASRQEWAPRLKDEVKDDTLAKLRSMVEKAELGGGQEEIEKQHKRNKSTARERVNLLLDPGTFLEFGMFAQHHAVDFGMDQKKAYGDGVVTGLGKANGRDVVVVAQDFTFLGGSLGEVNATKAAKSIEEGIKLGVPVVFMNDSGGARIQEGVDALKGYGDIFYMNTKASGVVPQIAVIMGPCAGGAVYSPALMDFIIMVRGSGFMFITGPKVVKAMTGEDTDELKLGGADAHFTKSGVADFVAADDADAVKIVRKLLSYLPQNNLQDPPRRATGDDPNRLAPELNTLVPTEPYKAFNMYSVIEKIFDKDTFFEVKAGWARSAITGFARLHEHVVGVIASQPNWLAGVLDIDASDKISRFVMFCDAFGIPLVTLVDVPGFMPGTKVEHGGIIRHGAKILYAYSRSTVPKLTLEIRKAYGGAYIAMSSKHLGADFVAAWPTAEIAVMGAEGAAEVLAKKELAEAKTPEEKEKVMKAFVDGYRKRFGNPYYAASKGYVDQIVEPAKTRPTLIRALEALLPRRSLMVGDQLRKHGVVPV
jgi:acetyl-CoA carboxylase carboxyltransferase component